MEVKNSGQILKVKFYNLLQWFWRYQEKIEKNEGEKLKKNHLLKV
jgi:hypothetical protein